MSAYACIQLDMCAGASARVFRIGENMVKRWRQRGYCLLGESESQPRGSDIEGGRVLLLALTASAKSMAGFILGIFNAILFHKNKQNKDHTGTTETMSGVSRGDPSAAD